ncbi:MAG: hypothetical protein RL530_72, partial [Actinomycetota bacterium]
MAKKKVAVETTAESSENAIALHETEGL